jgi:predicted membrane protein
MTNRGQIMEKGTLMLKTDIRGLMWELIKKLLVVGIVLAFCLVGNRLRIYVADRYNITDSIFKADILGTVSMIVVYIVLGILALLLIIAVYKFLTLFYELKHVTTIDFTRERIIVQRYEFPFDKQIEEKRFNRIVGVEVTQKTMDRAVNAGSLYVEYLVQSKNDSKLRGIEVPYILNPINIKDKLLEDRA